MDLTAVIAEFEKWCGAPPTVVASAPGRVNIIGEHTDYNDGLALPFAIDRRVWVAAGPGVPGQIRVHSTSMNATWVFDPDSLESATPNDGSTYLHGAVALLNETGHRVSGAHLWITGDLPAGRGLASSAALCVATSTALARLTRAERSEVEVVQLARRIEHEFAGTPCGIMDPYASVFGRADHALLLDCRTVSHQYVPVSLPRCRFLLIDSGVRHELSTSAYAARVGECRRAVSALAALEPGIHALRDFTPERLPELARALGPDLLPRARHVATENQRVRAAAVALEAGRVDDLGALLSASHASLRDDYEVSCPEIEVLIAALDTIPGVVGSRMIGGGFGGAILALVRDAGVQDLASRIERQRADRVGPALKPFVVTPAGGATVHDVA